jgi:hypothetical protein
MNRSMSPVKRIEIVRTPRDFAPRSEISEGSRVRRSAYGANGRSSVAAASPRILADAREAGACSISSMP